MKIVRLPMRLEDCPVKTTADVISGKWKALVLYYLKDGPIRFGQLKRLTQGASHKVLTEQLRELEMDGVVQRVETLGKTLKVEYSLSEYGQTLAPILSLMAKWGADFKNRNAQASADAASAQATELNQSIAQSASSSVYELKRKR
ncbi:winged helix-turn-helix transcriptional regulator [Undibacterium sp. JH2W]|uniref:winged helix-turn-helix transcriptional regulator n=1 Tax=Undibacterium sp. JH2W TaxID=3413037 RepID=UPI003BF3DE0E